MREVRQCSGLVRTDRSPRPLILCSPLALQSATAPPRLAFSFFLIHPVANVGLLHSLRLHHITHWEIERCVHDCALQFRQCLMVRAK